MLTHAAGKYTLLESLSSIPSGDTLERVYLTANPQAAQEGLQVCVGGGGGWGGVRDSYLSATACVVDSLK
jgi:hypothetical protein